MKSIYLVTSQEYAGVEEKKINIASLFILFQALSVILDRHHTQDAIIAERIQQPLGLR